METTCKEGIIFDIQRFSVHDGPGIRTLVFFKGCPLRCRWCSNPEGQSRAPQLFVIKDNCIRCGQCIKVCPTEAVFYDGHLQVDRDLCCECGSCSEVCYPGALTMTGRAWTVDELINELKKDEIHYRKSNGGITLSGGEVLAQPEFARDLLKACKANGWHTAIETSGVTSDEVWEMLLPYLDMVLFDIKHMNADKHKKFTGHDNRVILRSAMKLAGDEQVELVFRVPVIPGFNDETLEIAEIACLAKVLEVKKLHLLPYHPYGEKKYVQLGMKPTDFEVPEANVMEQLKAVVKKFDVVCQIGG